MKLYDYVYQILHTFPDAKFIYLCRDGRDVACSEKKKLTGPQEVYQIAANWQEEQQKCLQIYHDLQSKENIIQVKYEQLISQPILELQRICNHVGLSFEEKMLTFYQRESSVKEAKAKALKNLNQPVLQNNIGKYRTELSAREVEIFEIVAQKELQVLKYPLTRTPKKNAISKPLYYYYLIKNNLKSRMNSFRWLKEEKMEERQVILKRIYTKNKNISNYSEQRVEK